MGNLEDALRCKCEDNTNNGKCVGCGECCSRVLPITEDEIRNIKRYIENHGIKETYQPHNPLLRNHIDWFCPFLNANKNDTRRCNIYPVRPQICKAFNCHDAMEGKYNRKLLEPLRGAKKQDMRVIFYPTKKNIIDAGLVSLTVNRAFGIM